MVYGSKIDRRRVLKAMGVGGAVASFPGLMVGADGANAAQTIRTLMWEGYENIVPAPVGYELAPTFMVANEDPINKRGTYDVSVGILGIYSTLYAAGVIQPLDKSRIPNWSLLDAEFTADPLIEQGLDVGVGRIDVVEQWLCQSHQ